MSNLLDAISRQLEVTFVHVLYKYNAALADFFKNKISLAPYLKSQAFYKPGEFNCVSNGKECIEGMNLLPTALSSFRLYDWHPYP